MKRGPYRPRKGPKDPKTLGERIHAVRSHLGYTQEGLAAKLRTDQSTVSAWEVGKTVPAGPTLLALSGLFGLSVKALADGQGFCLPEPPESTVAAEARTPWGLPPLRKGQTILRVQGGHEPRPLDLASAVETLQEALREERPLWIVVG